MKTQKIRLRTCVISKVKLVKKDFFRLVRTPEGNIIIDETGKSNGRGSYLKKDKSIIEKAKSSKILEKHLETKIPEEIYNLLLEKIN